MNKGKIILYTFVGICIAYGIAVIIFCLVNASSVISRIISIIPVLLFGGGDCSIPIRRISEHDGLERLVSGEKFCGT